MVTPRLRAWGRAPISHRLRWMIGTLVLGAIGYYNGDRAFAQEPTPTPATLVFPTSIPPTTSPPGVVGKHGAYAILHDATGQLWGIDWGAKQNALRRWNGKQWREVVLPAVQDWRPAGFDVVSDGAVLCLWHKSKKKENILTEHKGNTNRILAHWNGGLESDSRLFRTSASTWITHLGKEIYRVQNGVGKLVYTLKPAQLFRGVPESASDTTNELFVLEGADRRTWFWANEATWGFNGRSMRGLLVYDGKNWMHHPHIQGTNNKPFTAFAVRDAHTFWLGSGFDGLYELDAQTLKARRVTDPGPQAFWSVQAVKRVNGVWYVVADNPAARSPVGDYSLRESVLWRWNPKATGKARWELILNGLDFGGDFTQRMNRPIVADKGGLWVGAISGGAWWIPLPANSSGHAPVHVDWRRGFNLDNVQGIAPQKDGRLLAFNTGNGIVPNIRSYLRNPPTPKPRSFTTYSNVIKDNRQHLWYLPSLRQRVLREWDGAGAKDVPIPARYDMPQFMALVADASGRIWLMPGSNDRMAAIYTPQNASWQFFPTYAAALQEQLKRLGPKKLAQLKLKYEEYLEPVVGSGNRIAYHSPSGKLFYFDGAVWHQWTMRQIVGPRKDDYSWEKKPFFSKNGNLCMVFEGVAWLLMSQGTWRKVEELPVPEGESSLWIESKYYGVKEAESFIKDDTGAMWLVKDGQLYKSAWGLCMPLLKPNERHVVRAQASISEVILDAHGTPFFETNNEGGARYTALEGLKFPDTKATLVLQSANHLVAQVSANSIGRHWFRWRLDSGPWSKPQTAQKIDLSDIIAGKHRLEVAAINEQMQIDGTPAAIQFQVASATSKQIRELIEQLRSPDYARREAAVQSLAAQPDVAAPALRAARVKAGSDFKWWIDAALQEIENRRATPTANLQ